MRRGLNIQMTQRIIKEQSMDGCDKDVRKIIKVFYVEYWGRHRVDDWYVDD